MQIYKYDRLSDYLKDIYLSKKKMNDSFSIRSWAIMMGIPSAGAFNQMLSGKRKLSLKYIPAIIQSLNLDENEKRYFLELYISDSSDEKSLEIKENLQKLNPFKWRKKKKLIDEDLLDSHLFLVLRTILKRKPQLDLNFLKLRKLICDDIENREIINLIDKYNVLDKMKKRLYGKDRLVTQDDIENVKVQKGHQFFLNLASKRIKTTDVTERNYSTYSVNIDSHRLPQLKERIRFFTDSLIEEFGDEKGDITYQLGNYLFPITKKEKQ